MPKTALQAITGFVVMGAWCAALFVGLNTHDYQGLQLVTPVMLVYAGYMFGDTFFQRRGKNSGDS